MKRRAEVDISTRNPVLWMRQCWLVDCSVPRYGKWWKGPADVLKCCTRIHSCRINGNPVHAGRRSNEIEAELNALNVRTERTQYVLVLASNGLTKVTPEASYEEGADWWAAWCRLGLRLPSYSKHDEVKWIVSNCSSGIVLVDGIRRYVDYLGWNCWRAMLVSLLWCIWLSPKKFLGYGINSPEENVLPVTGMRRKDSQDGVASRCRGSWMLPRVTWPNSVKAACKNM